jgi:predicted PurR-regulated permease PerM
MNKKQLFLFFFISVSVFLLFQLLRILSPFFTGLFGAILLSIIFWPIHRISLHLIGSKKPNLSAGVSTAVLLITIVVPLIFITWLLYQEMRQTYPLMIRLANTLENWRQGGSFSDNSILNAIQSRLLQVVEFSGINFRALFLGSMKTAINFLISASRKIPSNALSLIANVAVMITTIFFIFRDGPSFFNKLKDLIPMDEKHKDHIARQLYITITAIVRGVVIVALVQGFLAWAGFTAARVPSPLFLGFLTSIFAIVPIIGSGIVWASTAIFYFATGVYMKAFFIFLWGFFIVGFADNFLRPILIGDRTRLPYLAVFLGLVGGIKVYGPMGIFFGPLIAALILAFAQIYREEYDLRLNKEEPPPPPNGS